MGIHKEGEPQKISTNRIYNVPPERREKVFRLRTAILQAYYKLEQEEKIPSLSKRQKRKATNMKPSELLRCLVDVDAPLLKMYILETMTGEEYKQYVDSLSGQDRESPLLRAKRFVTNFLNRKRPQN